ncbi:hypothetical protein THRCLA_01699, partial [Thraustotheca clavata]
SLFNRATAYEAWCYAKDTRVGVITGGGVEMDVKVGSALLLMSIVPSPVTLSKERCDVIEKEMLEIVHAHMDSSPDTREIDAYVAGYKIAHEYPNSKALYRKNPDSPYKEFMIIADCDLSLDEYVELTYCESTEAFRTQQTIFYGESLLDARILNVTYDRTEDDPFRHFGVRYKRMNMANNGVFSPRDTTFIEFTGSFVNKKGLHGVYCVRESMDFEEVPPFPNVVRFYMKAIFLFTETKDDKVESLQLLYANPLGQMPAWMFNKTSLNYSHVSDDYAKYIHQKRLLAWVAAKGRRQKHANRKAKTCSSCGGSFRGLRARHECWGCSESMCGKCVVSIPRVLTSSDGSMKATQEEFCKKCFVQARAYRTSSNAQSFRELAHSEDATDTGEHPSLRSSHHSNCTRSSSSVRSDTKEDDEKTPVKLLDDNTYPTWNDSSFDQTVMETKLSQMQLGIETQRYLVAQMRSRLEAQANVGHCCLSHVVRSAILVMGNIISWNSNVENQVWEAARMGNLSVLEALNPSRSVLEWRDKCDGRTAFTMACKNGHVGVATWLQLHGADKYARDYEGNTPLHYACFTGQSRIVTFLLNLDNFTPYLLNAKGETPLDVARRAFRDSENENDDIRLVSIANCIELLEQRCSVFSGWSYYRADTFLSKITGISLFQTWSRRYCIVLRTSSSMFLEISLFTLKEQGRRPPVPSSTILVHVSAEKPCITTTDPCLWMQLNPQPHCFDLVGTHKNNASYEKNIQKFTFAAYDDNSAEKWIHFFTHEARASISDPLLSPGRQFNAHELGQTQLYPLNVPLPSAPPMKIEIAQPVTFTKATIRPDCIVCFDGPQSAVCVPCGH